MGVEGNNEMDRRAFLKKSLIAAVAAAVGVTESKAKELTPEEWFADSLKKVQTLTLPPPFEFRRNAEPGHHGIVLTWDISDRPLVEGDEVKPYVVVGDSSTGMKGPEKYGIHFGGYVRKMFPTIEALQKYLNDAFDMEKMREEIQASIKKHGKIEQKIREYETSKETLETAETKNGIPCTLYKTNHGATPYEVECGVGTASFEKQEEAQAYLTYLQGIDVDSWGKPIDSKETDEIVR